MRALCWATIAPRFQIKVKCNLVGIRRRGGAQAGAHRVEEFADLESEPVAIAG